MARGNATLKNHTLYLPCFETGAVSQILPIIGSFTASQILVSTNITMIKNGLRMRTSV